MAEKERAAVRMRERRIENPVRLKNYQIAWNAANRGKIRQSVRARNQKRGVRPIGALIACRLCPAFFANRGPGHKFCESCSREKKLRETRQRAAEWCKVNAERRNRWFRERFAKSARVRLNVRMSRGIGGSLKGGKEGKSWRDLVPYSLAELTLHIERQFLPGMNWSNMGDWHIDHIVPLAHFSFEKPSDPEFAAAWALTNLRPLWGGDNVRKNAKRLFLL